MRQLARTGVSLPFSASSLLVAARRTLMFLVVSATLVLASCSEGKVSFIGVDEVVWNFDFSKDGQHVFLVSGWYKSPPSGGNEWYPANNRIRSFQSSNSALESEVWKGDGDSAHVFSCVDSIIFGLSESFRCANDGHACGCCSFITFRMIHTGKEIARTEITSYWGHGISAESNLSYYRCDDIENLIYLWITTDTISAIDPATGRVIHEYIAQDVGEFWSFELQEESDRLLLFDSSNNRIWVFRLSTAERLGVVEIGEGHPPYEWFGLVDCVIADADHVVCTAMEHLSWNESLAHLLLVDLPTFSVERNFPLGKYIIYEQPPTPMPGGKVLTVGRITDAGPKQEWHDVLMTDLATGETTIPYTSPHYGWMSAFPDRSLVRIIGRDSETDPMLWKLFRFPEFTVLAQGEFKPTDGPGKYLPKRGLYVVSALGYMTIFGIEEQKYLDVVRMCDGADYWFRVDATERYAGVLCHGTENYKDVVAGIRPRGAGVAVLDLARYFRE